MVFSSLLFIYAFLPVFLTCYYVAPERWRNGLALVASLVFYAWSEPVFVGVLLLASIGNYHLGRLLAAPSHAVQRRRLLAVGLTLNLGLLGYCKYANFFVAQSSWVLGELGQNRIGWSAVALPIGISFFTFQKVSYLIDLYRGTARPARNLADFLLYVALFPQLIAGPIVRYHDIEAQIRTRTYSADRFLAGVWRLLLGLGKKVLIANQLGAVADGLFALSTPALPMPYAWVALMCYTFQIYFDFSGYSDMAIGLACTMGFDFPENFRQPYTSRSVTEFWQRWHCSLSAFMRDYLYIPLGGNRGSQWRSMRNLWVVFLASGFWHGASWNFLAWGAYHGSLLSVERATKGGPRRQVPAWLKWLLTFLAVSLGWVLFRSESLTQALAFYGRLVAFDSWSWVMPASMPPWPDVIGRRAWSALVLAACLSFIPDTTWERWGWARTLPTTPCQALGRILVATACLGLATAALVNQSYNPFIYFRF